MAYMVRSLRVVAQLVRLLWRDVRLRLHGAIVFVGLCMNCDRPLFPGVAAFHHELGNLNLDDARLFHFGFHRFVRLDFSSIWSVISAHSVC